MAGSRGSWIAAGVAGLVIAAAAVLAPGVPAARAASALTPAITVADGNTVIAVQTSGSGLRFYWNEHGTTTWHGEQVAPDGTTFSSPSIAQVGDFVVIAAQGASGSLDVYWQPNGGDGWSSQVVAGPNTTNDAPSVTADGNSVIIAAEGAWNSLDFYWAAGVGSDWHQEQVAGPATTYSSPSQTVNGDSVNIAAEGPSGSLDFYWAANGTSTWTREVVAGPGAIDSAPAITVNDGSVDVVANLASNSGLALYWAANGTTTWHPQPVMGLISLTPAITTDAGVVHVVSRGWFGALVDFATTNGTGTWQQTVLVPLDLTHSSPFTGPGSPAVTMNDGIENVANIGSSGNLYFWWNRGDGGYSVEVVDTSANL
jgi:hypothetical protein